MRHSGIGPIAGVLLAAALVASSVVGAHGQVAGGGPSPASMNSALVRLLGPSNFIANATVTVKDTNGTQVLSTPMEFALLDGKVRAQIDQSQTKSKEMSPAVAASLMQLGLSRVVSVIRPDKQAVYIIYPDKKAMVKMPISKEDAEAAARTPKIQKTVLGKETIDGHPCVKTKVIMTLGTSQPIEAITWNATDLKDFPIQIETTERGHTSVILFRQLRFTRPDPGLFEAPAGFATYPNPHELMQSVAREMQKGKGADANSPAPKKK